MRGFDDTPIGMYSGNQRRPDTVGARLRDLFATLFPGAGITRLSSSHDPIGTYYGLDVIPPERFPLGPPAANRPADFEGAAFQEVTWEP